VLVVQGDAFNRSAISTVVCVPLTSNVKWAGAPGNVPLRPRDSGLSKESIANVSQVVALDRTVLVERVAKVPSTKLDLVLRGIDVVLGRV
jgi:mRNA interferase MazF